MLLTWNGSIKWGANYKAFNIIKIGKGNKYKYTCIFIYIYAHMYIYVCVYYIIYVTLDTYYISTHLIDNKNN